MTDLPPNVPYECGYAFGMIISLSSAEKGIFVTEFRVTHTREGFHILPTLRRGGVHEWLIFLIIFYASPVLYFCILFLFYFCNHAHGIRICGWVTSVWVNGKATA